MKEATTFKQECTSALFGKKKNTIINWNKTVGAV